MVSCRGNSLPLRIYSHGRNWYDLDASPPGLADPGSNRIDGDAEGRADTDGKALGAGRGFELVKLAQDCAALLYRIDCCIPYCKRNAPLQRQLWGDATRRGAVVQIAQATPSKLGHDRFHRFAIGREQGA